MYVRSCDTFNFTKKASPRKNILVEIVFLVLQNFKNGKKVKRNEKEIQKFD